ncbi:hypothetical protein VaNZ11_003521 [Volvox africanus]|uniref:holo-[acyl-carrier-protein] synthase n=1 Tax=Volvox africanus TaxID=51714 RepID=A0ABQ5RUW7_9CHLO|nr:hypothetical protein VaNZ11_003521 [Volvox africanus]
MPPTPVGALKTNRVGVIPRLPSAPQRTMPHSRSSLTAVLESFCSTSSLASTSHLVGSGLPRRACTFSAPAAANDIKIQRSLNSAAFFSRSTFSTVAAIMGTHVRMGVDGIVNAAPGCRQSPSASPWSYNTTTTSYRYIISNEAVHDSYRRGASRRGWCGLSSYGWGAGSPSPPGPPDVLCASQRAPALMWVSTSSSASSPAVTATATTTMVHIDTAARRSNTAQTAMLNRTGVSTLGASKDKDKDEDEDEDGVNWAPSDRGGDGSDADRIRSSRSNSESNGTAVSPVHSHGSTDSTDSSSTSSVKRTISSRVASRWPPAPSAAAVADQPEETEVGAGVGQPAAAVPQTRSAASFRSHGVLEAQECHNHHLHHQLDVDRLHQHQHQDRQLGHGSLQLPPPHSAVQGSFWRQEGPGVCPAPGKLQIWWAPLDTMSTCNPPRVARYGECLSTAEAREVAGSRGPEIAARRTAARALARCVMARAVAEGAGQQQQQPQQQPSAAPSSGGWSHLPSDTAVLPKDLEFRRTVYGKPHLLTRPGWPLLHHNLTHTNDLAGVAVFRPPLDPTSPPGEVRSATDKGVRVSYAVGLDVERVDRAPRDPMALARRRLAAAEIRDLESLSSVEERARHFMWLWTLKEAYVKARGTGISAPPGLRGFAIGFEDMSIARVRELKTACGGTYSFATSPKTITLQHTIPSAGSSGDGAATPGGRAIDMVGVEGTSDGGDCRFEGAQTHFHFLLIQPTPRHVAALCVAVHPAAAAAAAAMPFPACPASSSRSQQLESSGCHPPACRTTAASEVEAWGDNPGLRHADLGDHLAALVEHWWCEPLEMEGRLSGAELTLLGAS